MKFKINDIFYTNIGHYKVLEITSEALVIELDTEFDEKPFHIPLSLLNEFNPLTKLEKAMYEM